MNTLVNNRARSLAVFHLVLWSFIQCFPVLAHSPQAAPKPQSQATARLGDTVSLFNGKVSFSPPAEFEKMTDDLILKKYPELNLPRVAFSNVETTVSVLVAFAEERNLRPEQLPQFKEFMTSTLEKAIPELHWLKKELEEINGRSWIHLEYISRRFGSREVHNDAYITSLDNRMLLFNFNATVTEFEKSKDILQRSRATIAIKEQ